MTGLLLNIIIDEDLFMLEFFKTIRIGVTYVNDKYGKATALLIGFWKFETNLTFVWRKKLHWNQYGEA